MTIVNDQPADADDFIDVSAGAGDSGKVPKLNASGDLDYTFLKNTDIQSLTAGQNVTAGEVAIIGDGLSYISSSRTTSTSSTATSSTQWLSQNFATSSRAISIKSVIISITGSNNVTISIYAIDGSNKPTGAALGSLTQAASGTIEFTFASPVAVSPSTTYAAVMSSNLANAWSRGNTDNSGGISTDSGATWTMNVGNFYLVVNEIMTVAGRAYKAEADVLGSTVTPFSNNYIGIFEETATSGNAVLVRVAGVSTKVSGLAVGVMHFISDTAGALSATAGTITRKIGIALSATKFLIKHDNP